jgi:type VI protein secretion system component VasF
MLKTSTIRELPHHKKMLFFWVIMSLTLILMVLLWIFLDTKSPKDSVTTQIREKIQSSQDFWKNAAKEK